MDIKELRKTPHLSASSVSAYIDCSLAYKFRYVDGLKSEYISDALVFGSAIHVVLAEFYMALMIGDRLDTKTILNTWDTVWHQHAVDRDNIQWKRGNSYETALSGGLGLLAAFSKKFELPDAAVVAVEEAFSMTIPGLDIPIIGVMDLVTEDPQGVVTIVDHKTTAKAYSARDVDANFQATVYSMAARANGFANRELLLRFDCLIKTKEPRFEQYFTVRNAEDEKKAAAKIRAVWNGIQKGVFIPNDTSWKCAGCGYKSACNDWYKENRDE